MKKLLLPLFLIISGFIFGQGQPCGNYQQFGSATTRTVILGLAQGVKGVTVGRYADTATANSSGCADYYAGTLIVTDNPLDELWQRNSNATKWINRGSVNITSLTFLTDSSIVICFGNGVCDTIALNNFTTIVSNIINNFLDTTIINNGDNVFLFNDSTLIICNGAGVCDTINLSIDSVNNFYFLNDSTIVVCDTPQVIQVGDVFTTQQVCDTISVPRQRMFVFQNGVQQVAPGIVEHGNVSADPNPGQLQKDTYLYTDFYNYGISGAPYLRPTLSVQNKQWTQISSSITSFNSLGGNPYQFNLEPDNINPVNLYVNYMNRFIEGSGVFAGDTIGTMYDRIGYSLMTNSQGTRAGYSLQSTTAKQTGIMFHTFDTQYTDAVTIFGNQVPNPYLFSVSPFPTTTLLDSRIAVFKTTGQVQFPEYTALASFPGTAVGVIGFDASGNLLTIAAGSGSGTVTSFSSGNLSPLFTTSVATATTTPAQTFSLSNAAARTVFGNSTSSSAAPSYTTNPITSTYGFAGSSSGVITVQTQAAAGTFNFNLPITAGTSGYVLTSGGGGATAMTWTNPSSLGLLFARTDALNSSGGAMYFDNDDESMEWDNIDFMTFKANGFSVSTQTPNQIRLNIDASVSEIYSPNGNNALRLSNTYNEWLVQDSSIFLSATGGGSANITIDDDGAISLSGTDRVTLGGSAIYASTIPYNSGGGIVALGVDTVAASPTFNQIVRKTASAGTTYTGSELITLSGSDFQFGGTATTDRTATLGANTVLFTANTLAGDPAISITSTSTAAASNAQKGLNISLSGANANASQSTYAAFFSNTHTGTSPVNYGLYSIATGADVTYGVYGEITSAAGAGVQGIATSGTAIAGAASSGNGGVFSSTSGLGAQISSAGTYSIDMIRYGTSTSDVLAAIKSQRQTTGTAADGIGHSFDFYNEDASATMNISNQMISKWTTAANLTRVSEWSVTGVNNAVTQTLLKLAGSGQATLSQYGSGTFTGTATKFLAVTSAGLVIEEDAPGGSSTWNGITDPTGDQALTFGAGEGSIWTNSNTTEDLLVINSSTITTSSFLSLNSTSTALAAGNNLAEFIMSGANGTNAITANPVKISVTNTNATSGTNTALLLTASGATTANNAIEITAGTIKTIAGSATQRAIDMGDVGLFNQTSTNIGIYAGTILRAFIGQSGLGIRDASTAVFDFGQVSTFGTTNYFRMSTPAEGTVLWTTLGATAAMGHRFTGGEAALSFLDLFSDEGDDVTDKWRMESQVDNDYAIMNNSVEYVNITSAGVVTLSNLAGTGSRAVVVDANGLMSAPVSDFSVKQNIKSLNYGLNTIMQLNPVSFEYKDGWKNYGQGTQIGFIAQDVNKVLPNSTFITPSTGKMGYNSQDLITVLVRSQQELYQMVVELQKEIVELKAQKK